MHSEAKWGAGAVIEPAPRQGVELAARVPQVLELGNADLVDSCRWLRPECFERAPLPIYPQQGDLPPAPVMGRWDWALASAAAIVLCCLPAVMA